MKWLLIITGMLGVLVGCRDERYAMNDNQIVCNLHRQAFVAQPGAEDITFLVRAPSADPLCAGLNVGTAS